jgi:hypothetical protein
MVGRWLCRYGCAPPEWDDAMVTTCPRSFFFIVFVMVAALAARAEPPPPTTAPQSPPAGVDPKADELLRKMGAHLRAAREVSFTAHAITDQFSADGQKIQYAKNQKVRLRRPDKLACDVAGDTDDLQFRYDGSTVTLYNPRTNSWGSVDAPATIDRALDDLAQRFGVAIPLADLVFPDPYQVLIENVRSGQYIGDGYVMDTPCHHLAFRQAAVDWQIWIEHGPQPLPRKIVITFKELPAHPQYTAFLSDWNLKATLDDDMFRFHPPAGAKQVEFAPPMPATPTTQPATLPGQGTR